MPGEQQVMNPRWSVLCLAVAVAAAEMSFTVADAEPPAQPRDCGAYKVSAALDEAAEHMPPQQHVVHLTSTLAALHLPPQVRCPR